MDDTDTQFSFVFNKDKILEKILLILVILAILVYIYLERVKNFERFNINGKERDAVMVILCFIQSILVTYV